jgi:predicted O-methyltransferase YrrM
MIHYIGDLSRRDAELLRVLAVKADRILEFGAGASTQIFAAYGRGTVETVETDLEWIEKTHRNFLAIGIERTITFHIWQAFVPVGPYSLIFVDGIDELRREFAFKTWPTLAIGGVMCFHDTRRTAPHGASKTSDIQNALAIAETFSPEVDRVVLNQADSNITVVTKRAPLLLEDWNAIEGRTAAMIGIA